MCSDPQEILNKETGELCTVACRVCDQCIAVRRHGWVARAMAEKAMWKHTLCIALTYNDATQENRDAAAMFAYADVRAFLNRLRSACRDDAKRLNWNGTLPQIKFLAAGEQGSRNGRCHWHLIIYSDWDIRTVGEVTLKKRVLTDPRDMLTIGKRVKRLHWSLWGKGFVTFQEPDQGGMNYVLSYCLKDQFTEEKSEGTARHAKAENFATGLFRMSKRPAIGDSWIIQKMETLLAANSVLPSLQIKIPGFRGYWFPSGSARKRLVWHIKAVANLVRWRTGKEPPQWSGLIHGQQDNLSDMEILLGQETQENKTPGQPGYDVQAREADREARDELTRRKCGGLYPCEECCFKYSDEQLADLGIWRGTDKETDYFLVAETGKPITPVVRWQFHRSKDGGYFSEASSDGAGVPGLVNKGVCNQACLERHLPAVRRAFAAGR